MGTSDVRQCVVFEWYVCTHVVCEHVTACVYALAHAALGPAEELDPAKHTEDPSVSPTSPSLALGPCGGHAELCNPGQWGLGCGA